MSTLTKEQLKEEYIKHLRNKWRQVFDFPKKNKEKEKKK